MFLKLNAFAIIWAIVVAILILLPGKDLPGTGGLANIDKIAHAIVFAVLTILVIVGFKKQFTFPVIKKYSIISSISVILLYSVILESIQLFVPDRQFDKFDMIANTMGISFGLILFVFIYRI